MACSVPAQPHPPLPLFRPHCRTPSPPIGAAWPGAARTSDTAVRPSTPPHQQHSHRSTLRGTSHRIRHTGTSSPRRTGTPRDRRRDTPRTPSPWPHSGPHSCSRAADTSARPPSDRRPADQTAADRAPNSGGHSRTGGDGRVTAGEPVEKRCCHCRRGPASPMTGGRVRHL